MKRSEMQSIIADFLYELNLDPDEASSKADELLSKIESTGMEPPSVCWKNGKFNDSVYISHHYQDKDPHYWEDEE